MATTVTIDLRHVARGLGIPLRQVQAVVELLDEGNTVPFITRYRKDQTGGLDEEQIRQVQGRLTKMRLLADRKQTILRSIEAQGKLTEDLAKQIQAAGTTKRLEDLYLPFKPRKQTLATAARMRGLEPLAREILAADPVCADLDARARDFVSTDRHVPSAADALLGAGHILAEQFSEQAELRQRLREILQRTGKFVSTQAAPEQKTEAHKAATVGRAEQMPTATPSVETNLDAEPQPADPQQHAASDEAPPEATSALAGEPPVAPDEQPPGDCPNFRVNENGTVPFDATPPEATSALAGEPPVAPIEQPPGDCPNFRVNENGTVPFDATPPEATSALAGEPPVAPVEQPPAPRAPAAASKQAKMKQQAAKLNKKELKKKRIDEMRTKAFRDYFSYSEEIKKIPPHRILAINRGERAKVLRVKIECDVLAMYAVLDEMLVPPGHPHAEYLRGCARDALSRLILPSLEREVRRELTDRAETHAVEVFAKNLRNLLLQPPVRDRRLLAVDPGFKSGCKLVALDQFGNMLEHGVIFLVGKPERREQARQKVLDLITRLELSAVVIGNGTACRESEDFFAELLEGELKGRGIAYVIVNEAGASVYSTSRLGREEFPNFDATLRGAISIGRRLQDPLSELVKIDPANIGVGLYQHDVKAKHLRTSLDDVVESCVNYVGVDINTASPALLRYVSGLNQLTARRVYEHRCQRGPFQSREQLREVPGFGEATFVQAAGFLKIAGGGNPLDATWIHPESYEAANRVLAKLECTAAALTDKTTAVSLAQRVAAVDREAMAKELAVGTHTLNDILAQLARPGRDPREDLPAPVFKQGVLKLEDLAPGMELTGTVLNVVDFGAFVDIGMHDSGLVHVSHLADKYVRDPHEVVAVGDIVKVWVLEVDKERRRVSLTMVRPGTERERRAGRGEKPEGEPAGAEAARPRPARPPEKGGPRPAGPRSAQPSGPGRSGPPSRPQGPPRRGMGPPPPKPKYQPPKPRPKPLIPITDAMKVGKEPMRTFGDLLQFYSQQSKPDQKAATVGRVEPLADDVPPPTDDKAATVGRAEPAAEIQVQDQSPPVPAVDRPAEQAAEPAPPAGEPPPQDEPPTAQPYDTSPPAS